MAKKVVFMKSFSLKSTILSLSILVLTSSFASNSIADEENKKSKKNSTLELPSKVCSLKYAYHTSKNIVVPVVGLYLFYRYTLPISEQYEKDSAPRKTIDKYLDLLAGVFIYESIKTIYNTAKEKIDYAMDKIESTIGLSVQQ